MVSSDTNESISSSASELCEFGMALVAATFSAASKGDFKSRQKSEAAQVRAYIRVIERMVG
jgi:hypothetical protein